MTQWTLTERSGRIIATHYNKGPHETTPLHIRIPYGVTELAPTVFESLRQYGNTLIASIHVPETVKRIDKDVFKQLHINELTGFEYIEEIGQCAFQSCTIPHITLPKSLTLLKPYAFACAKIEHVTIHPDAPLKSIRNHTFFNATIQEITIPRNVTTIYESAFEHANLKHLYFAENSQCRRIAPFAFSHTQLKNIYLPDSIEYIGKHAFDHSQLETVRLPINPKYTHITSHSFSHNALTTITLPVQLTTIQAHALANNQLTTLDMSQTHIETIEQEAFAHNRIRVCYTSNHRTCNVANTALHGNPLSTMYEPSSPHQ